MISEWDNVPQGGPGYYWRWSPKWPPRFRPEMRYLRADEIVVMTPDADVFWHGPLRPPELPTPEEKP